jgi:hypothetical protein
MTQPNIPNIAARRRQSFFAIRFATRLAQRVESYLAYQRKSIEIFL